MDALHEVFMIVDRNGHIMWTDHGPSAAAIPDKLANWEAVWAHRDTLAVLAHSHPLGPDDFSAEDRTTMIATVKGLGRPVWFGLVTPNLTVVRLVEGTDAVRGTTMPPFLEPAWARKLRRVSSMMRSQPKPSRIEIGGSNAT